MATTIPANHSLPRWRALRVWQARAAPPRRVSPPGSPSTRPGSCPRARSANARVRRRAAARRRRLPAKRSRRRRPATHAPRTTGAEPRRARFTRHWPLGDCAAMARTARAPGGFVERPRIAATRSMICSRVGHPAGADQSRVSGKVSAAPWLAARRDQVDSASAKRTPRSRRRRARVFAPFFKVVLFARTGSSLHWQLDDVARTARVVRSNHGRAAKPSAEEFTVAISRSTPLRPGPGMTREFPSALGIERQAQIDRPIRALGSIDPRMALRPERTWIDGSVGIDRSIPALASAPSACPRIQVRTGIDRSPRIPRYKCACPTIQDRGSIQPERGSMHRSPRIPRSKSACHTTPCACPSIQVRVSLDRWVLRRSIRALTHLVTPIFARSPCSRPPAINLCLAAQHRKRTRSREMPELRPVAPPRESESGEAMVSLMHRW